MGVVDCIDPIERYPDVEVPIEVLQNPTMNLQPYWRLVILRRPNHPLLIRLLLLCLSEELIQTPQYQYSIVKT